MEKVFLSFSVNKFRQLSARIGDCLNRLSYDQIWLRGGESQNSIGNLVLHLCGNVRQWIGFGVAGLPDIRVRDQEFSARGGPDADELRQKLDSAVAEACSILEDLPAERLAARIVVQKYDLTALEGIYHVVEHFAQHTGQIIFMTKLITGADPGFYKHLREPSHGEITP
jgi:uncharacterized damage-inducible protein DinB